MTTPDFPAVLRYKLQIGPTFEIINMPQSHKILSVAPGRGGYHIDVWVKVEPHWYVETPVTFRVFGTGHPIPDTRGDLEFIGTCVMSDGLVWHVFEEVLF